MCSSKNASTTQFHEYNWKTMIEFISRTQWEGAEEPEFGTQEDRGPLQQQNGQYWSDFP